jgi:hypothetical protein
MTVWMFWQQGGFDIGNASFDQDLALAIAVAILLYAYMCYCLLNTCMLTLRIL